MNNESIYQQYMYSYPHKTAYRELNNIAFADVKSRIYEHKTHLYIHMPFARAAAGFVIFLPAREQTMPLSTTT